jgi:hypothetical protein
MAQDQTLYNTVQDRPYVLLSLGTRALLMPQNDIRALESVLDVQTSAQPAHGVGWLQFENNDWPVYSLDEALQPLSAIPSTQRICALLGSPDGSFGLTCTNATTLRDTEKHIRPIPAAMRNQESPLCGLAIHGGRIGLVCTADTLAQFLRLRRTVISSSA